MHTQTKQTAIKLKPEFIMVQEDIYYLNSLPENKPETLLSSKDKTRINKLYFKCIYKPFDGITGLNLCDLELKNKWPGGEKTKQHEAQRLILEWLMFYNEPARKEMSFHKATTMFHKCLTHREANRLLLFNIYDIPF